MGSFDSTASGRFYQNACGEKPESTIGKLFIFNQPHDRNLTLSTFSVFLAVFCQFWGPHTFLNSILYSDRHRFVGHLHHRRRHERRGHRLRQHHMHNRCDLRQRQHESNFAHTKIAYGEEEIETVGRQRFRLKKGFEKTQN